MRQGHVAAQAAHGRHLVRVHGVDDAARPEEEQRLEHGVREEVEHRGHVAQSAGVGIGRGADPERDDHEADLRDGAEGQHALDVALHAGHDGGVERREGADVGRPVEHLGSVAYEEREHARHEVDTRDDHRRGMDQRRDGRRALHGVGQPDVQREHGTLAGAADEHQPERQRNHRTGRRQHPRVGREGEGPGVEAVEEDADQKAQVGEARDDEGLFRGGDRLLLRVVEADEQVGAYTHQLPKEVHLEDVRGDDQSQHAHREERQEGVVALEAPLALHVSERVDVDHERDGRDDDEHHHRDGIEQDAQVDVQRPADGQPEGVPRDCRRVEARGVAPLDEEVLPGGHVAQRGDDGHDGRADESGRLRAHLHAEEAEQQEAHEGQHEQKNRIFHKRLCLRRITTSCRAGS